MKGKNMPLTFLKSGTHLIRQIRGKDDTKNFLQSLGFIVGGEVTVVSENGGNIIVNIKGSRVAIDKSMASRIIV